MLKKTILILVFGFIGLLCAFLVTVTQMPADFRIERSIVIAAPPRVVFDQVNNFRKWEAWSPWAKMDPSMKTVFEGAESGVGAVSAWDGNREVGAGKMTLTESRAFEWLAIRLEFTRPMAATNRVEFSFQPENDKTKVTWAMSGKNGFVANAFALLLNMDKLVGGQFEKGLVQMKAVSEAAPKS
jgi:hypothetical protein